jgi:hypothetical protein
VLHLKFYQLERLMQVNAVAFGVKYKYWYAIV